MAAPLRMSTKLVSAALRLSIRQTSFLSNTVRLNQTLVDQVTTDLTKSSSASSHRFLSTSAVCCTVESQSAAEREGEEVDGEKVEDDAAARKRPVVDVQTSIRYMNSRAYKITYGEAKIWEPYRRNFKGQMAPKKTRKTCIRKGAISTGNPCPICRDEFLVLHPENVSLLKQFVTPHTGDVISYEKTGLCQMQHDNLLVAMHQAWDLGYIEKVIPFRTYDYSDYYPELRNSSDTKSKDNQSPN